VDPELLSLDDLPAEAQQAIDETEREITELRDRATRQTEEIHARAEQAVVEIEDRVIEEVRQRELALLRLLRPMQDSAARAGRLDEALAIRDRIRDLRARLLQAQTDPGNLSYLTDAVPGTSLLFEVIGRTDGIVWGTDVYTSDSTLAAVAVHAGAVREDERGVVRVTFVDTLNVSFVGSERNGVESLSYGPWPIGYRVSRA
jgi:hypothetical protein